MVNRGRSGRCVTCKQRRVKCDETKPECWPCQRLGLRCGGYMMTPASLKFKDQNHKFSSAGALSRAARVQSRVPMPCPRQLAEPDTAVPFFLGHYASSGRSMESTRGFFEILTQVYCLQRQNSVLSLAVSAVSSGLLSMWRQGTGSFQSSRKTYTQAITRLRDAIQNRAERGKPETLLAVLTLQLYESIAAVYGLRSAMPIHHNGAISLLSFAYPEHINGMAGAYIRKFILHTEISSAMRQKRPLQAAAYSLIASKRLTAAPDNPSSVLDAIGVSVVELQASYTQLAPQDGSTPSSQRVLREWRDEAKRIDKQLLAWVQTVPDHWHPLPLTSGQDIDPSTPTYQTVCEVYPSCQIANIWNLWRIQRLLLANITLSSLRTTLYYSRYERTLHYTSTRIQDFIECKRIIQALVDAVCHSVPFYLGNRTKFSTMADFTDPTIFFPSYHSLARNDMRRLDQQNNNIGASRREYERHVIAQGPWHIMNPLSRLLTLSAEDHGQLMASSLRPGQHEWIREQFLRVTVLLGILPRDCGDNPDEYHTLEQCGQGFINTKAESLARQVRKGTTFMSGP